MLEFILLIGLAGEPFSATPVYAGSFTSCEQAISYAKEPYPSTDGWDKYMCIRKEFYVKS